MISPQLINAFVECLLELEDLVCAVEISADEEKEKRYLLNEMSNLLTRIVMEVQHEKK